MIYDEDNMALSAHYKSISERNRKNQFHGKSYSADKRKQRASYEKKLCGRETPTSIKCFKCGELVNHANECRNNFLRCFKCGKIGNCIVDCKSVGPTCYNCGEQGHIITNFQKPKKVQS